MIASATKSSIATRTKATAPTQRRRQPSRPGPILARDAAIDIGKAVRPCPYNANERVAVQVNRRVDVLAQERSAGRIDEAQFLVGRMIQAVFERGSGARLGSGGWGQGGSRDQTIAHELQIIFAVEDAEKVRKFTGRLEQAIGGAGVRFMRAILAEGHTFKAYAERTGKGSTERASGEIAQRFRWLLEELTDAQHTAHGAGRLVPDDQYARRAAEVAHGN